MGHLVSAVADESRGRSLNTSAATVCTTCHVCRDARTSNLVDMTTEPGTARATDNLQGSSRSALQHTQKDMAVGGVPAPQQGDRSHTNDMLSVDYNMQFCCTLHERCTMIVRVRITQGIGKQPTKSAALTSQKQATILQLWQTCGWEAPLYLPQLFPLP